MLPPDRIRRLQQNMADGGERAFDIVPMMLKNVIEEEQWKHCSDRHGKAFTSFEAFVKHELWEGLGSTIDDLKVFCRKRDDVRKKIDEVVEAMPKPLSFTEAGAIGGRGHKASSVTTGFKGRGATYQLKRLKRDRPDLADKVVSGEMSAHAAALEAGFRKKLTPFQIVLRQLPKLTNAEKGELWEILGSEDTPEVERLLASLETA